MLCVAVQSQVVVNIKPQSWSEVQPHPTLQQVNSSCPLQMQWIPPAPPALLALIWPPRLTGRFKQQLSIYLSHRPCTTPPELLQCRLVYDCIMCQWIQTHKRLKYERFLFPGQDKTVSWKWIRDWNRSLNGRLDSEYPTTTSTSSSSTTTRLKKKFCQCHLLIYHSTSFPWTILFLLLCTVW